MSRVLPILFNTDMVRAILDGRKTVTRRVAKKVPNETHRVEPLQPFDGCDIKFECNWGGYMPDVEMFVDGSTVVNPPYKPGDILYIRETWCKGSLDYNKEQYYYRADNNKFCCKWHPSIHMPKEAARIWLKVTDVRVEKLHEIDDNGILAEGLEIGCYFDDLWNSTIKKKDLTRYGWDANPWVWVIEFSQCGRPETTGA